MPSYTAKQADSFWINVSSPPRPGPPFTGIPDTALRLISATWDKEEMQTLDEQTQLKLSQRRNWFLERLLKLGTIDVKREYTCASLVQIFSQGNR
jgi:hypothetical protein